MKLTLREKCPITEFFWPIFSRIQSDYGKYGPEKKHYLETFHTVLSLKISLVNANKNLFLLGFFSHLLKKKFKDRIRRPELFCKKGVLENYAKFTGKRLWQSLLFNKVAGQTLPQVFSCEFCKIFKNTFLTEHFRSTTSI